jgi:hypothetical protein
VTGVNVAFEQQINPQQKKKCGRLDFILIILSFKKKRKKSMRNSDVSVCMSVSSHSGR